jgi:bacterioferritin-associated ferredoxin
MYVCICKGITDTQIRAAIEAGASSLRELHRALGVASQCGKCGELARDIVRDSLAALSQDGQPLFYAAG